MNVLVVNCGSSSLKYQLLDMTTETELAKGLFEKIGDQDAIFTHKRPDAEKLERVEPILDHKQALKILLDILVDAEFGVISSMDEIDAIVPALRAFVLPGGYQSVSFGHIARTVCRRAERSVIHLQTQEEVEDSVVKYLNRLSDYLFMLCRAMTYELGIEEVTWKPRVASKK